MKEKTYFIQRIFFIVSLFLTLIFFILYFVFHFLYQYNFVGEEAVRKFVLYCKIELLSFFAAYFFGSICVSWVIWAVTLDKYENRMNQISKTLINFVFVLVIPFGLFCGWTGYRSNIRVSEVITSSYVKDGYLEHDYSLMKAAEYDLKNNNLLRIETKDPELKFYYHDYGDENTAYIIKCVDSDNKYHKFRVDNSLSISDGIYEIEYYERSRLIKSIVKKEEVNEEPEEKPELSLEITDDGAVIINRTTIDYYDNGKSVFSDDEAIWLYITENGEFYEVRNSSYKTWDNSLSYAKKGDYTVTLVTNYNENTGEYTPISNTIEYAVE